MAEGNRSVAPLSAHNLHFNIAVFVHVLHETSHAAYGDVTSRRIERVYERWCVPAFRHAGTGGHVTVRLECVALSEGVPVMHHVQGDLVRAAYDPDQIDEAAALAWLCISVPRLLRDGFQVMHAVP